MIKKQTINKSLNMAGTEYGLSHTAASTFLNCRKKFYYQYVEKLEPKFFNIKFFIGRVVNIGISNIYSKRKNYAKTALDYFSQDLKKARKQYIVSADQEQELQYAYASIEAMLTGYAEKHKKFIHDAEWLGSEVVVDHVTSKGTKIYGKIDNRLKYKNKIYLHELKTSKYLNTDYVQNIKNDPQTALYLHSYNTAHTDKIHGIIYDVIMKPSIRQKQNEDKHMFIQRLSEYYMSNDEKKFYMEIIERPFISAKKIFNVMDQVTNEIKECTTSEKFYENFNYCLVRYKCEYYDLCFKGENNATLGMFKTRQRN